MDTISDMLTRIRNASSKNHEFIIFPFSNIKFEIAKLLKKESYIEDVKKVEKDNKKDLVIKLAYDKDHSRIMSLKRISKPGCRIFKNYKHIYPVLNGKGIAIISTSKGLVTDKIARKEKIGGEVICEIY